MFKQYFSFVLGIFEGSEQKYLHCFQNSILGINKKRLKNRDNEIPFGGYILSSEKLAVCTQPQPQGFN